LSLSQLQKLHREALKKAAEARKKGNRKAARQWSRKARELQEKITRLRFPKKKTKKSTRKSAGKRVSKPASKPASKWIVTWELGGHEFTREFTSKEEAEEFQRQLEETLSKPIYQVSYRDKKGRLVIKQFHSEEEAEKFAEQLKQPATTEKWTVTYVTEGGETVTKEFASREEAERFARAMSAPRVIGAMDAFEAKGVLSAQPIIDITEMKERKAPSTPPVQVIVGEEVKTFASQEEAEAYIENVKQAQSAMLTAQMHRGELLSQAEVKPAPETPPGPVAGPQPGSVGAKIQKVLTGTLEAEEKAFEEAVGGVLSKAGELAAKAEEAQAKGKMVKAGLLGAAAGAVATGAGIMEGASMIVRPKAAVEGVVETVKGVKEFIEKPGETIKKIGQAVAENPLLVSYTAGQIAGGIIAEELAAKAVDKLLGKLGKIERVEEAKIKRTREKVKPKFIEGVEGETIEKTVVEVTKKKTKEVPSKVMRVLEELEEEKPKVDTLAGIADGELAVRVEMGEKAVEELVEKGRTEFIQKLTVEEGKMKMESGKLEAEVIGFERGGKLIEIEEVPSRFTEKTVHVLKEEKTFPLEYKEITRYIEEEAKITIPIEEEITLDVKTGLAKTVKETSKKAEGVKPVKPEPGPKTPFSKHFGVEGVDISRRAQLKAVKEAEKLMKDLLYKTEEGPALPPAEEVKIAAMREVGFTEAEIAVARELVKIGETVTPVAALKSVATKPTVVGGVALGVAAPKAEGAAIQVKVEAAEVKPLKAEAVEPVITPTVEEVKARKVGAPVKTVEKPPVTARRIVEDAIRKVEVKPPKIEEVISPEAEAPPAMPSVREVPITLGAVEEVVSTAMGTALIGGPAPAPAPAPVAEVVEAPLALEEAAPPLTLTAGGPTEVAVAPPIGVETAAAKGKPTLIYRPRPAVKTRPKPRTLEKPTPILGGRPAVRMKPIQLPEVRVRPIAIVKARQPSILRIPPPAITLKPPPMPWPMRPKAGRRSRLRLPDLLGWERRRYPIPTVEELLGLKSKKRRKKRGGRRR